MASPAEILAAIAPELSAIDASVIDIHLDMADTQTGTVYGKARNQAVALLAAHTLTIATRGGYSGAITSRKEGELSVSFGVASGSALSATGYGQELEHLRRAFIMGARTVLV